MPRACGLLARAVAWQRKGMRSPTSSAASRRPSRQGSRRAVVGWSDGTTSEALRWIDDSCGCPH